MRKAGPIKKIKNKTTTYCVLVSFSALRTAKRVGINLEIERVVIQTAAVPLSFALLQQLIDHERRLFAVAVEHRSLATCVLLYCEVH